ncbi:40S ribosomal protein SA [Manis javanica]|nr:40S ribosomal protein SA [Manis javanica]
MTVENYDQSGTCWSRQACSATFKMRLKTVTEPELGELKPPRGIFYLLKSNIHNINEFGNKNIKRALKICFLCWLPGDFAGRTPIHLHWVFLMSSCLHIRQRIEKGNQIVIWIPFYINFSSGKLAKPLISKVSLQQNSSIHPQPVPWNTGQRAVLKFAIDNSYLTPGAFPKQTEAAFRSCDFWGLLNSGLIARHLVLTCPPLPHVALSSTLRG